MRKDLEIVDHGLWFTVGPEGALIDALREQPLARGVTTIEDRSAADQCWRREDEAGGLHEAEPLEVRGDVGILASVHGINSCPARGTRARPARCASP